MWCEVVWWRFMCTNRHFHFPVLPLAQCSQTLTVIDFDEVRSVDAISCAILSYFFPRSSNKQHSSIILFINFFFIHTLLATRLFINVFVFFVSIFQNPHSSSWIAFKQSHSRHTSTASTLAKQILVIQSFNKITSIAGGALSQTRPPIAFPNNSRTDEVTQIYERQRERDRERQCRWRLNVTHHFGS